MKLFLALYRISFGDGNSEKALSHPGNILPKHSDVICIHFVTFDTLS